VDWFKRRYELFDRFDTSDDDPDDERYVIDIHRSLFRYELYIYRDVIGPSGSRGFYDVWIYNNFKFG
jgi:hypothetical protein